MEFEAHLYFGSDEKTCDANKLQWCFKDVLLCGHEAIKVVLRKVIRLPVQLVHLAYLKDENTQRKNMKGCLELSCAPIKTHSHVSHYSKNRVSSRFTAAINLFWWRWFEGLCWRSIYWIWLAESLQKQKTAAPHLPSVLYWSKLWNPDMICL